MKRRRDTECPKRCDRQRVRFLRQKTGTRVLDLIRTQAFQLVFLDLNMPLKNGLAVLKEIPQIPGLISPEVIVVTANDTLDHAIECIRHGRQTFSASRLMSSICVPSPDARRKESISNVRLQNSNSS